MLPSTLTARPARLLPLLVVLVVAGGCQRRSDWREGTADPATGRTVVLFAPVHAPPVQARWSGADHSLARDAARRIELLSTSARAWAGVNLPSSADPAWAAGRVAGVAGADLVILTVVDEIEVETGPGTPGQPPMVTAWATMRAIDIDGRELWAVRRVEGRSPNRPVAKAVHPAARPVSKAAWNAIGACLGNLDAWIEGGAEADPGGDEAPPQASSPHGLVGVTIDSVPANADIFVDDLFRGTTPMVVPLPQRPLLLRLQRQGFQPWERRLTPGADMRIQPALAPSGAGTPPPPPTAPPAQPQPPAAATSPATAPPADEPPQPRPDQELPLIEAELPPIEE